MHKGESLHTYFERVQTSFNAHDIGGFGWPVDAHYAEEVAARLADPDHGCSLWLRGEPPQAEAAKIRRACVAAFQAVVLMEGLTEAYKGYVERCEYSHHEGNRIYPPNPRIAKDCLSTH